MTWVLIASFGTFIYRIWNGVFPHFSLKTIGIHQFLLVAKRVYNFAFYGKDIQKLCIS